MILKFLKNQLNIKNFFGKSSNFFIWFGFFLLLVVIIVVCFFIGKNINLSVISNFDIKVNNFLLMFRTPGLTKLFLLITEFGDFFVVVIFVVIAILFFWLKHWRFYIIPLIVSIVGSEFFVLLGKMIFHRQRPDFAVYQETSFSLPSGHAAVAVAFYGFLIYVFLRNAKMDYHKIIIFLTGLLVMLIIGFSRLYLGVHYVSDVFVGYLVGIFWLLLIYAISRFKRKRD